MLEDQHIEQVCDNYVNVAYQGQAAALVEKRVKASAGSKVGGIQEEVDEI